MKLAVMGIAIRVILATKVRKNAGDEGCLAQ